MDISLDLVICILQHQLLPLNHLLNLSDYLCHEMLDSISHKQLLNKLGDDTHVH